MAINTQIVEAMNQTAIFNLLSEEQKKSTAGLFEEVFYRLGETIICKGESTDALYILLSGQARLIGYSAAGEEKSLSLLKAGMHFGEQALLTDKPAEATIAASTDIRALRLSKAGFEAMLRDNPGIEKYFRDWAKNEGMQLFLKNSTILSGLDYEAIRSLLDHFEVIEFAKDSKLVQEGDEGDFFFIIRSGAVLVEIGEENRTVNKLLPGDCFGELALLTGAPRKASVRAIEATTVYCLGKSSFEELVAQFPVIRISMEQMAAGYSQEAIVIPSKLDNDFP